MLSSVSHCGIARRCPLRVRLLTAARSPLPITWGRKLLLVDSSSGNSHRLSSEPGTVEHPCPETWLSGMRMQVTALFGSARFCSFASHARAFSSPRLSPPVCPSPLAAQTNVSTLNRVLHDQVVHYDFITAQMPFPIDLAALDITPSPAGSILHVGTPPLPSRFSP